MLRRHIAPALGALVALMAAAMGLVVLAANRRNAANHELTRIGRVVAAAQLAERHTIDLETGLRAYLATGDRLLLAPWTAARAQLPSELRRLHAMSGARNGTVVRALSRAIAGYETGYAGTLLARPVPPRGTALDRAFRSGKVLMDHLRARYRDFDLAQQARQSTAQRAVATTGQAFTTIALGAGIALLLAMLALVGYLARVVVAPLRRAIAVCAAVSSDESGATLTPSGVPELRALAQAFNEMLARLAAGRAELALAVGRAEEAGALHRAAFDRAHHAYVAIDDRGRVLVWNEAAERMFGYGTGEALGADLADLIVPESFRVAHRAGLSRALSAGESRMAGRPLELRAMRRDGSELSVEFTLSIVRQDGRWTAHAFLADISARHAAEADQRLLAAVVQTTRDAVITADAGGRVTSWNDAAVALFQYSGDEVLGRTLGELLPSPAGAAPVRLVTRALAGEVIDQLHTRGARRDGTLVDLSVNVTALREGRGEAAGVAIMARDVTVDLAARRALEESRRRLALVLHNLADSAITVYDRDQRLLLVEGPLFDHMDLSGALGRSLSEIVGEATLAILGPGVEAALAGETSSAVLDADRDGRPLAVQFAPYRLADGTIDGALLHWRDLSAVRTAERDRDQALQHFRAAFERAPIGMVVFGLDGRFRQVNEALCELTGRGAGDLQALAPYEIVVAEDREHVRSEFAGLAGGADTVTFENRVVHGSGHAIWVHVRATLIRDGHGAPMHVLAQVQDITERRRHEEGLRHLADHDPLTGLLNRRGLDAALEDHLARCRRYGAAGALLMLDLDNFKQVNDTLGHAAGDALICACAEVLGARLRETDVVTRLGGDEFAVLLPAEGAEQVAQVAHALVRAIRDRVGDAAGGSQEVTASIGAAVFTTDTLDAETMLARADLAMYEAKRAGRDRFVLLDADGRPVATAA